MSEMLPLMVLMTLSNVMEGDPLDWQIAVLWLLRLKPFVIALLMRKRLAHKSGHITTLIVMNRQEH
jgi:hypothetical protein